MEYGRTYFFKRNNAQKHETFSAAILITECKDCLKIQDNSRWLQCLICLHFVFFYWNSAKLWEQKKKVQ